MIEKKKEFPLVSVMMPVYNGEMTLPFALASLQAQTYTNWNAIIVNDGSTDSTKEYLDSLNDTRFKIIHFKKNKGRPYARQAALDAAEGKYLAFLDADDLYHPEKLEKQVKLMEENPDVDLISCGNASYDENFNIITVRGKRNNLKKKFENGDERKAALRTSIIKLKRAKQLIFNKKLKHAQDTDFIARYLRKGNYIITDEVLYYYSEFISVTGLKILRTYWYDFLRNSFTVKESIYTYLQISIKIILKFLVTLILLPITGTNFFLKRRGHNPSHFEKIEFEKVIKLVYPKKVNPN